MPNATPSDDERRSLRWRCRRGMQELDWLCERYLAERYPAALASEQRAFSALLDTEDDVLWDWFIGHAEPPAHLSDVVEQIRALSRP